MIIDYYQKTQCLSKFKGSLYEEKIIELIKSKINHTSKEINKKRQIIAEFNKPNADTEISKSKSTAKNKSKLKKLLKSSNSCINQL